MMGTGGASGDFLSNATFLFLAQPGIVQRSGDGEHPHKCPDGECLELGLPIGKAQYLCPPGLGDLPLRLLLRVC